MVRTPLLLLGKVADFPRPFLNTWPSKHPVQWKRKNANVITSLARSPWSLTTCFCFCFFPGSGARIVLQGNPDDAIYCQLMLDGARWCHWPPDAARCFQVRLCALGCWNIMADITDAAKCSKVLPDLASCARRPPNDARYCQMLPDVAWWCPCQYKC